MATAKATKVTPITLAQVREKCDSASTVRLVKKHSGWVFDVQIEGQWCRWYDTKTSRPHYKKSVAAAVDFCRTLGVVEMELQP
jgi:hypothetical protein